MTTGNIVDVDMQFAKFQSMRYRVGRWKSLILHSGANISSGWVKEYPQCPFHSSTKSTFARLRNLRQCIAVHRLMET